MDWLITVSLAVLCIFDGVAGHVCDFVASEQTPPPLSSLEFGNQFQATVVAVIKQKNYSIEITEYFDYELNKAAIFTRHNGSDVIMLYDYEHYEFRRLRDGKCKTRDLRQQNVTAFQFTSTNGTGHVQSINDILKFGRNYNETFIGEDMVRGLPVYHWANCQHRGPWHFAAHFYVSKPGFKTPAGDQEDVLVRVEVDGFHEDSGLQFDNIYDFMSYKPGPVEDLSVFEVPQGYVCDHLFETPPLPELPSIYTIQMEIIEPLQKMSQPFQQLHDLDWKLTRTDFMPPSDSKWVKKDNTRFLTIIEDIESGVEYIMDTRRGNCSFREVQSGALNVPNVAHKFFLKYGLEVFNVENYNLTLQGRRSVRGIPCEVWSGLTVTDDEHGVIEFYYAAEGWNRKATGQANRSLVGIWRKATSAEGKVLHEFNVGVHHFETKEPDYRDFTIAQCFSNLDDHLYAMVRIPGKYPDVVHGRVYELGFAVRNALATAAGVNALRINDIVFDASSVSNVDVWFTLVDKVPANVAKTSQISITQAKTNLVTKLDSDAGITITLSQSQESYKLKKGSFVTDSESFDPRRSGSTGSTCPNPKRYSPGSMAVLAFCMLGIGAILGVGVYYIWKKRSSSSGSAYMRDPDL